MSTPNTIEEHVAVVTEALHIVLSDLPIDMCESVVNAAVKALHEGDDRVVQSILTLLTTALKQSVMLRADLANHKPTLESAQTQRDIRRVIHHALVDHHGAYGMRTTLLGSTLMSSKKHPRHPVQVAKAAGRGDLASLAKVVKAVVIFLTVANFHQGISSEEREVLEAALRIESALMSPTTEASSQLH